MTDPLQRLAYDRQYRHDTIESLQDMHDETFARVMAIGRLYEERGTATACTLGVDGRPIPGPRADLLEMGRAVINTILINEAIAELEAP